MPLYTARVFSSRADQPDVEWNNSFELSSGEAPFDSAELENHATNLNAFIATLSLSTVIVKRVVISTWVPDSEPYNPDNLKTVDFFTVGAASPGSEEKEATDTVLKLKRSVDYGRSGKLELRYCLTDSMVDTNSGTPALTSTGRTTLVTRLGIAVISLADTMGVMVLAGVSQIDKIYEAAPAGTKQVVRREYSKVPHVRSVKQFVLNGVGRRDPNNKYFDKN